MVGSRTSVHMSIIGQFTNTNQKEKKTVHASNLCRTVHDVAQIKSKVKVKPKFSSVSFLLR